MEESILTSIKKLLGVGEEYTQFDTDIIMHINSVFMVLNQLGVGPDSGFSITDKTATWKDFLQDETNLEGVKSYMYAKVKLLFDPPLSSSVTAAIERIISEFEWRLYMAAESKGKEESQNE